MAEAAAAVKKEVAPVALKLANQTGTESLLVADEHIHAPLKNLLRSLGDERFP